MFPQFRLDFVLGIKVVDPGFVRSHKHGTEACGIRPEQFEIVPGCGRAGAFLVT